MSRCSLVNSKYLLYYHEAVLRNIAIVFPVTVLMRLVILILDIKLQVPEMLSTIFIDVHRTKVQARERPDFKYHQCTTQNQDGNSSRSNNMIPHQRDNKCGTCPRPDPDASAHHNDGRATSIQVSSPRQTSLDECAVERRSHTRSKSAL